MGQVAEHLVVSNRETIGHGIQNALIGLVQQHPVDLVRADIALLQQRLQDGRDFANSEFVDLLAIHGDRSVATLAEFRLASQRGSCLESRQIENASPVAIAAQQEALETLEAAVS